MKAALKRIINIDMKRVKEANLSEQGIFIEFNEEEKVAGMRIKVVVNLVEGISKDSSKVISNIIKKMKLKVQSQIQGDQIRVSSKKIDDLQSVMQQLKSSDIPIALQFINMKK